MWLHDLPRLLLLLLLSPPPEPPGRESDDGQSGDDTAHGNTRLGSRGETLALIIVIGKESRSLGIIGVEHSGGEVGALAPAISAWIAGAAPQEGGTRFRTAEPLYLRIATDAVLALNPLVGIRVEAGSGEVAVGAIAGGRLARVDGAAADELGGFVVADVK
ncbi:unnamed protein product [Clonostachys chloroleuca]|uniref:Uncharacterized protein n=1 Tax=Clonostachys chloroleuca TaxID=1926264 RepID=A0AA35M211_9HYPO|nr:unnamed protein product [Clonostachys chloroleuca]